MSALFDLIFHQAVPLFFAVILAGILLSALAGTVDELTTRAHDRRRHAEEQERADAQRDERLTPESGRG